MARLHPAVAACRTAVRRMLAGLSPGELLLVACSGGADSLALAAAALFAGPRAALRVGLVTVDHRLQPDSASVAAGVARWARTAGADPVEVCAVTVAAGGGPEAAARRARYAALDDVALRLGAAVVLLGHTQDDQAETVLLRLARGSGARSLAGIPPVNGRYRRPFLDLPRQTTRAACDALGLQPWSDPHNVDPSYARARVRTDVLPALRAALGPGAVPGLARSARLLRADADALDALAAAVTGADGTELSVAELAALAPALRSRALRQAALASGCPPGAVGADHVAAIDALVTCWHGQGPVSLPGGRRAARVCGMLRFTAPDGNDVPVASIQER